MDRRWKALTLVAALAAACGGGGSGSPAPADDGGAWMDGARVEVRRDEASGRETVTLVDEASGFSQVMQDEPLVPGAVEWDEEPAPMVVATTAGPSSRRDRHP